VSASPKKEHYTACTFRYKALLAVAFLLACSKAAPPPDLTTPLPAASIAQAAGLDAAGLAPSEDPSPPAGDLASEVAHFTTLDACVKEHAKLDPLVGDALRSIGYETFLRDSCRLLEATRAKSVTRCDPIDASSLRARCRSYVAMATASPDTCPWLTPADTQLGRDPTCVAVAAGEPRLCAAEELHKRATCTAVASRDEGLCAAGAGECRREATRWRGMLPEAHKHEPLPDVRGHLQLRGGEALADASRADSDLHETLAQGVVLAHGVLGDRLSFANLRELEPAATPLRFKLRVLVGASRVPAQTPGASDARVESLSVEGGGGPRVVCPDLHCDVRVTVKKLEPVRGGAVQLEVEATSGVAPDVLKLHAELATFVRDVVGP
jgi:hypothetical protein